MQSNTSPKKPSPLSYGSPRTSPFRRPESPSTATLRASTPTGSPVKSQTPLSPDHTPRASSPATATLFSPRSSNNGGSTPPSIIKSALKGGDPLSKVNQQQLRDMRESFQVLDRDNDGSVNREDVFEVFKQLGDEPSNQATSAFFPPSSAQTINLSTYLHSLATPLSQLSPSAELIAAFSAFDVDDSGQVDLDELRDALLNTPPEPGEAALSERDIAAVVDGFTGRRAFGGKEFNAGQSKRGEVFKYQEFVASVTGAGKVEGQAQVAAT